MIDMTLFDAERDKPERVKETRKRWGGRFACPGPQIQTLARARL